ncbi:MAG: glycine--tRNA ligase [Myxococcales bacterium]|nr:glycine--tRNA ligase [Myxococcota bacterium]MDW8282355.1 glycine--tRNA ligase [Myxococcales bacterium]
MDKIVALTRRRGFIFQSSELYGGINGAWDYGPVGVQLKRNVKDAWWRSLVEERDDIVGLDTAILMHPMVWKASGHVDGFSDPMVDCKLCKKRFRADDLDNAICGQKPSKRPGQCGGELTEPRNFNLMFETFLGPVSDTSSRTFLRPETAQGIFVNFANVVATTRVKIPFGIAQIGKSFRNEINPRNFTFRSREFEQMELEFFVKPGTDEEWFHRWVQWRRDWYIGLGIRPENLRLVPHEKLAHYSRATTDVEYRFPFGWGELEGIANRGDFDLRQHQRGIRTVARWDGGDLQALQLVEEEQDWHRGKLSYFDEETKQRYIPYVIEPAAGADRATLAFLCDAYDEDSAPDAKGQLETREVLRLHPRLAPVKAAVLPLVRKDGQPERAMRIYEALKRRYVVEYDESGSIGKRYRRQDEIGTPLCITIDYDTSKDGTVTVRDRDSMRQVRVSEDRLLELLDETIHREPR